MADTFEADLLWNEATRDIEAEQAEFRLAQARSAVLGVWPFLAAATTAAEYHDRRDLADDRIVAAVDTVASDPAIHAELYGAISAQLDSDFETLTAHRDAQRKQAEDEAKRESTVVPGRTKTTLVERKDGWHVATVHTESHEPGAPAQTEVVGSEGPFPTREAAIEAHENSRLGGNPYPVGSPNWFEWEDPEGAFKNDPGRGPHSGVPRDIFPEGGVPLRGDLTPEQEAWLKSRGSMRKSAAVIVKHDGEEVARVEDENAAFIWLLRHQGQSVDYALKYGGYTVESEDGSPLMTDYNLRSYMRKVAVGVEPLDFDEAEGYGFDGTGRSGPASWSVSDEGVVRITLDDGRTFVGVQVGGPVTASMRKGGPFAGYDDFDDCVSKNQDADDPEAYCGSIKHKVEDSKESARIASTIRLSARDAAAAEIEVRRWQASQKGGGSPFAREGERGGTSRRTASVVWSDRAAGYEIVVLAESDGTFRVEWASLNDDGEPTSPSGSETFDTYADAEENATQTADHLRVEGSRRTAAVCVDCGAPVPNPTPGFGDIQLCDTCVAESAERADHRPVDVVVQEWLDTLPPENRAHIPDAWLERGGSRRTAVVDTCTQCGQGVHTMPLYNGPNFEPEYSDYWVHDDRNLDFDHTVRPLRNASRRTAALVAVTDEQVSRFQKALAGIGYRISDDEAHDILVLNGGYDDAMLSAGVWTERANDARWGEDTDRLADHSWGLSTLVETTGPDNFVHEVDASELGGYADALRQSEWADQLRRYVDTGSLYGTASRTARDDSDAWGIFDSSTKLMLFGPASRGQCEELLSGYPNGYVDQVDLGEVEDPEVAMAPYSDHRPASRHGGRPES